MVSALLLIAAIATSPSVFASGDTRLCNKGTTSLYFATMGEYEGFLGSKAMFQGLTQVAPDQCAHVVPTGMNKVFLAF